MPKAGVGSPGRTGRTAALIAAAEESAGRSAAAEADSPSAREVAGWSVSPFQGS